MESSTNQPSLPFVLKNFGYQAEAPDQHNGNHIEKHPSNRSYSIFSERLYEQHGSETGAEMIRGIQIYELSNEECAYHYNRLLGGALKWGNLTQLVLQAQNDGALKDIDLSDWYEIYGMFVNGGTCVTVDASNAIKISNGRS